ncbi:MAG: Gfo/Idh/MocA family oxidoreductase [Verrucomicrobiota bacterium]
MQRRQFLSATGLALTAFPAILHAQPAKPKIKIGQIGTAHAHASGKMGAIRSLSEDYEIIGIVEPNEQRRAAAQKNKVYAGLKWLTEEQLFNTKGLQAVAVETEVSDLLATAGRAIAAGKHIHLDKPAGESLPTFKKLLDDATRQKLTVQMGYMFRYNPAFRLCYQAVREGWLGRVFSIDTVISKVLDAASRQALAKYKGGSIFELGCHVIDSVVFLLGKPRRVIAYGRSSSTLKDGFLDNQLAVLEYPNATATVRSAMLEVDGGARRQFVVCGDKGTFDIRPLEPAAARMALDAPRGEFKKGYQDLKFPRQPRYDGEFIDLAKVIRGEKEFEWSPAHDLAVQETILLACKLPVT